MSNLNRSFLWIFSNLEWYLLRLGLWTNLTQSKGEHGGFISQQSLDTEAPLVRGETEDICEVLLMFFVYFITKQWFARFLKTFITKVISNTYTTALLLFVPSSLPWYCLLSPPCSLPLCVPFICSMLTLSLHVSEEPILVYELISLRVNKLFVVIMIRGILVIRSLFYRTPI